MILADLYLAENRYGKALEQLEIVVKLDPGLSDPHYSLVGVYYDLALVDVVARGLYQSHRDGYLLINPDATTRMIFRKAIDEFAAASKLAKSLTTREQDGSIVMFSDPDRSRMMAIQASTYLSGASEQVVFTADQAKLIMFSLRVNSRGPKATP